MTRMSLLALAVWLDLFGMVRAEEKHPLAGTWSGSLKAGNQSVPTTSRFSDVGRPIYDYATRSGARSVELTRKGQSFRFVPPGGGVATVTVLDVAVTPAGFRYQLRSSFQRAGGALLDQNTTIIAVEGKLAGGQLAVERKVARKAAVSGVSTGFTGGGSVTSIGPVRSVTFKGALKRK